MAQIAVVARPTVAVRVWTRSGNAAVVTLRPETFGERLRRLRRAAGLTQRQLADRAASTPWSVWSYEHDHQVIPARTLALFADALGCTMDRLWRGGAS